jgi:DNA-binding HxlR family transcriptional regulator
MESPLLGTGTVGDDREAFSCCSPLNRYVLARCAIPKISKRMLTQTLLSLERDGMISRHVFATKPPIVEYDLTALGESLFESMGPLVGWAKRSHAIVLRARERFDGLEDAA